MIIHTAAYKYCLKFQSLIFENDSSLNICFGYLCFCVRYRYELMNKNRDHVTFCLVNAFTPAQIRFQEESLEAHNKLRAKNCAPTLQLDEKLSQTAQQYAEYLASQNKFEHSGNGYGENLYMMSSSAPLTNIHGDSSFF